MNSPLRTILLCSSLVLIGFAVLGCSHSGRPGPGPEVLRPEQVLDFTTLYKSNCVGCHGVNGANSATIALANPIYLAIAGEANLRDVTAKGVPGKLMPGFAKSAGGMLTDQQIAILAHGMIERWGKPGLLAGTHPPPYKSTLAGDSGRGQQQFSVSCAGCHGANGVGTPKHVGSIVDGSYLALVSDQALRSFILAGVPGQMTDWRSDSSAPLNDQQVTDLVAWLASQRTLTPGQPYPVHP